MVCLGQASNISETENEYTTLGKNKYQNGVTLQGQVFLRISTSQLGI